MPTRAPDVEVAEIDGELVVLVPSERRAHHLDPLLALVFDACDGVTPLASVVAEIAEATSTSADEVTDRVGRAIQLLRDRHLVDPPADTSP
jgi:hypothetical protein